MDGHGGHKGEGGFSKGEAGGNKGSGGEGQSKGDKVLEVKDMEEMGTEEVVEEEMEEVLKKEEEKKEEVVNDKKKGEEDEKAKREKMTGSGIRSSTVSSTDFSNVSGDLLGMFDHMQYI